MTFNQNNMRNDIRNDSRNNGETVRSDEKCQIMGLHAVVECRGVVSQMDCCQLETLLSDVAAAAGATVLGAHFHDFGDGVGNTGVLILAESHLSVHSWPECNYAAIDMFVCGDARKDNLEPVEAAIDVLRSADRHGCLSYQILERRVPHNSKVGHQNAALSADHRRVFVYDENSSLGRQNASN